MVRVRGPIMVILAIVLAGLFTGGSSTANAAAAWEGSPALTRLGVPAFARLAFVGSWRLTVFPPGGQPPHAGLATFAIDGTLTAADVPAQRLAPPDAPPLVLFFSGGHGAWEIVERDIAAFTFDILVADENGNAIGTLTLRGIAALGEDGETIDAEYTVTHVDPLGNVLSSGLGAFEGTRIHVEPMEPEGDHLD